MRTLHHARAEAEMLHHHLSNPVLLCEPDPDHEPAKVSASLSTKASVLEHLPTCRLEDAAIAVWLLAPADRNERILRRLRLQ